MAGLLPRPQDGQSSEEGDLESEAYMHPRERLDFAILVMVFGALVAAFVDLHA